MKRIKKDKPLGFTLAEVLVTLGIIGVVASMTLPSVISHWRHKALEAQFKKSVAIISQIILQTKEDVGVDKLAKYCTSYNGNRYYNAEDCYYYLYQNMLKIKHNRMVYTSGLQANVRDRSGEKIKTYSGKHVTTTEALAAVGSPIYHTNLMADGSFLNFYISEQKFYAATDINGKKGPNQLGHDIFIFLVDKEKDILTATGKPYIYTDEELDEKDFEHEYQK